MVTKLEKVEKKLINYLRKNDILTMLENDVLSLKENNNLDSVELLKNFLEVIYNFQKKYRKFFESIVDQLKSVNSELFSVLGPLRYTIKVCGIKKFKSDKHMVAKVMNDSGIRVFKPSEIFIYSYILDDAISLKTVNDIKSIAITDISYIDAITLNDIEYQAEIFVHDNIKSILEIIDKIREKIN